MSGPEYRVRVYRATLDTNIFFRALIRNGNTANHLITLWLEKQYVLVLPRFVVDEVKEVVSRSNLIKKYQYALQAVHELIDLLTQRAVFVEIPYSYQLCRDRKDDPFVDCAIWGRVQFLVSYDNDLVADPELKRVLFEYGITIATPGVFAEHLKEELVV